FGRCAIEANRSRPVVGRKPVLHGDGRRRGSRTKKMMPAPVAWSALLNGGALRYGLLRQSRQRIELTDDTDHRFPRAPARDERRGDVGDAGTHLESRGLELGLQQRAALLFLVSDLRERPDLLRHVRVLRAPRVECLEYLVHRLRAALRPLRAERHCQTHCAHDDPISPHAISFSRTDSYVRSMIIAIPCPTPMHIVHSA